VVELPGSPGKKREKATAAESNSESRMVSMVEIKKGNRRPCRFTMRELIRAIHAVYGAGVEGGEIKIAPTGHMRILLPSKDKTAESPEGKTTDSDENEWYDDNVQKVTKVR
jgi:hypothetical protein